MINKIYKLGRCASRWFINLTGSVRKCQKSTVTVGFLILSMTLYICIAGVWNTGVLVDQKMQAQGIADAAALTAASQMSSTTNRLIMLNMLQLRLKSAEAVTASYLAFIAEATALLGASEAFWLAEAIESEFLNPFADLQAIILVPMDAIRLLTFAINILEANPADLIEMEQDLKLADKQKELVEKMTERINKQLKEVDNYTTDGYTIYVGMKDAKLYPEKDDGKGLLFRKSTIIDRLPLIFIRVFAADAQWGTIEDPSSPGNPKPSFILPALRSPKYPQGFKSAAPDPDGNTKNKDILVPLWYTDLIVATGAVAIFDWGYDLKSKIFFTEWNGNVKANRDMFQVVAMAQRKDISKSFMARGFFKPLNANDSVIAVSQAEMSNVYDELFIRIGHDVWQPFQVINSLCWRMWTSLGANYQGRLTRVDPELFSKVLKKNDKMAKVWKEATGLDKLGKNNEELFLH